jgi:hypothetical protein
VAREYGTQNREPLSIESYNSKSNDSSVTKHTRSDLQRRVALWLTVFLMTSLLQALALLA